MLNLHRLRLLTELRRRETIAAVAQALSYSPSTVSQQLALLETEAGTTLLEPAGRRLRFTPAGRILADRAESLLRQVEETEAELAVAAHGVAGVLRVASFQTAALHLIPATLSQLADEHPALRVDVAEIHPESSLPALAAGEFDLVIDEEYPGHPKPRSVGIHSEHLFADPLRLILPKVSHWPEATVLADLADAPWVMEPRGNAARAWTDAVCREAGFEPDVRFESSDLLVHHRLVQTGHACALLPGLVLDDNTRGVEIRALEGDPARRIFTAVRAGSATNPAIGALRGALRHTVRDTTDRPCCDQ